MATNAQVTNTGAFEMAVNGTFYDSKNLAASQWPAPATFPVRNPKGRTLQGHLTEWSVNTALEAGFRSQNYLNVTEIIHQVANYTVNTTTIGVPIPEIVTKYGDGKPIALAGILINQPSYAHATEGSVTGTGWLGIEAKVNNEVAIYAEFEAGTVSADIHTNSTGGVFGNLGSLSIGTIKPSSFKTTLPGVTAQSLQASLQAQVDIVKAQANAGLAVGAVIPSLFGITGQIEINLHKGFVEAGVDATPVTFQQIADLMIAAKQRVKYYHKMEQMAKLNAQFA